MDYARDQKPMGANASVDLYTPCFVKFHNCLSSFALCLCAASSCTATCKRWQTSVAMHHQVWAGLMKRTAEHCTCGFEVLCSPFQARSCNADTASAVFLPASVQADHDLRHDNVEQNQSAAVCVTVHSTSRHLQTKHSPGRGGNVEQDEPETWCTTCFQASCSMDMEGCQSSTTMRRLTATLHKQRALRTQEEPWI